MRDRDLLLQISLRFSFAQGHINALLIDTVKYTNNHFNYLLLQ